MEILYDVSQNFCYDRIELRPYLRHTGDDEGSLHLSRQTHLISAVYELENGESDSEY